MAPVTSNKSGPPIPTKAPTRARVIGGPRRGVSHPTRPKPSRSGEGDRAEPGRVDPAAHGVRDRLRQIGLHGDDRPGVGEAKNEQTGEEDGQRGRQPGRDEHQRRQVTDRHQMRATDPLLHRSRHQRSERSPGGECRR